jgi:hypothetical protein
LSIAEIVSKLKQERSRIDKAIVALEGSTSNGSVEVSAPTRKRGGLSAEGRKISEVMKKRWAERRKRLATKK